MLRSSLISSKIDTLISDLADKNGTTRQRARLALVDMGEAAVPRLTDLLSDKREFVRWEAASALGDIADPSSAPALVQALEDKVFDVRWLAAQALIHIGMDGLIPALKAVLLNKDQDWLWDGTRHIVHDLATDDNEMLLTPLKLAFDDVDSRMKVPIETRKVLIKLGVIHE